MKQKDATVYFMACFCFKPCISGTVKSRDTWPTYLHGLLLPDEGVNMALEKVLMFLKVLQDKQLFIACDVAQVSTFHLHIQLQFLVPQKAKFSIKVGHQCVDLEHMREANEEQRKY